LKKQVGIILALRGFSLVGIGAVFAAKGSLFVVYCLAVASLVDFASAVGANFKAGFYGNCDKVGESFEKSCAEFSSFSGEFKYFSFLFAYGFDGVRNQTLLFKLFQEWIDETGADFLSNSFSELADYAVAVGWSFI